MRKNRLKGNQSFITRLVFAILVVSLLAGCDSSGQVPDKSFAPTINNPAYGVGEGPLVCVDEAHNNFHTLDNRLWAFGELLRRDGYVVEASKEKFSGAIMERCNILVIANAMLESDDWGEYPYPTPSAPMSDKIWLKIASVVNAVPGTVLIKSSSSPVSSTPSLTSRPSSSCSVGPPISVGESTLTKSTASMPRSAYRILMVQFKASIYLLANG